MEAFGGGVNAAGRGERGEADGYPDAADSENGGTKALKECENKSSEASETYTFGRRSDDGSWMRYWICHG